MLRKNLIRLACFSLVFPTTTLQAALTQLTCTGTQTVSDLKKGSSGQSEPGTWQINFDSAHRSGNISFSKDLNDGCFTTSRLISTKCACSLNESSVICESVAVGVTNPFYSVEDRFELKRDTGFLTATMRIASREPATNEEQQRERRIEAKCTPR